MNSRKLRQNKQQPKRTSYKTIHLESITSTNDYAKSLADAGAHHGTLVIANTQTHGRGRIGSKWISSPGGLWMSIILRPRRRANRLALISAIASLAVTEVLQKLGVNGQVKWPNDVVVNGRKIAGILCESSVLRERFRWVIVGIGVNANNLPPILPINDSGYQATSIIQVTGEKIGLASLAESIRDSVMAHIDKLLTEDLRVILAEYNNHQTLRNRMIRVSLPRQMLEGVVGLVDSEGRLSLRSSDGLTHRLRSEDVLRIKIM